MSDQPSPRRRFQFRLRTLMIAVTLLAVPCAYVGWQAKIVRERRELLDKLFALHHGIYRLDTKNERVPWLRRLLGDEPVDVLVIPGWVPDERQRN